MLATRRLAAALKQVPLTTYDGELCRAVLAATLYGFQARRTYKPRPLYDLGAPRNGARFTPKNGAPALYLAADYDTCLREYLQVGSPGPVDPGHAAFVVFSVEVRLAKVLDLMDARILAALGTTLAEVGGPWRHRRDRRKPPTHVLGRAVAAHGGIQAIRFRSTKGSGACFVIFTRAIVRPAVVRVRDPQNRLVAELP